MVLKAKALLDLTRDYAKQPGTRPGAEDRPPKLGTIDPAYSGSGAAKVKFDGEAAVSTKAYVCVNCSPLAGDRVVLIAVGKTYVIIGTIGASARQATASVRYTAGDMLTTAYVTYPTIAITAAGGARKLIIEVSATFSNANSGANRTVDLRVQDGGVTLNEELTGLYAPLFSGAQAPVNVADTFLIAAPAAGLHTITMQARASAAASVVLQRASIVVHEVF